ncbi:YIP1 family protein [Primorskyibacter sp. 2E107]|uniref:YIP1 family protein n=1 Tax=Primorskyibacter sp. 2E107 TaxID=3403458 RepID=UPI003AF64EE0
MTLDGLLRLGVQTLSAPREVARLLLSLRLPNEALVLGFALTVVANALLFSISLLMAPMPETFELLSNPLALMAMRAVMLITMIAALTGIGRLFGGQASIADIAVLMIWLQVLGLAAQAALTLLAPLAGNIATLLAFAASAIGAYIATAFIDEAHELNSAIKAVLVLILGVIAAAVGLSILLSLLGFSPNGLTGYV